MQQSSWQVAIGIVLALGVLYSATTVSSRAQEATYSLTIHDTHFEPATLNVKAGVKFKLSVRNARKAAAEFESAELNREKIVPPGGNVTVLLGPLKPGSYAFFDDFHRATKGTIVAK